VVVRVRHACACNVTEPACTLDATELAELLVALSPTKQLLVVGSDAPDSPGHLQRAYRLQVTDLTRLSTPHWTVQMAPRQITAHH
jgi:hypothetical protein